ncbi:SIR2 family protein [Chloroflexota bacterium]
MCATNSSPELVFLLGAGASVKAGVPDTFRFVKEFQQSISDSQTRKTIDKIISKLKVWKQKVAKTSAIDIELLLETLIKLDERKNEPLLEFFKDGKFILDRYSEKQPIIDKLKDFIRSKAIIESRKKIQYLDPLRGFIEQHRPLDIVSLNYDTCIEQFCSAYNLDYQDGFDVNWNPNVFERENIDIRLYKLHGSVIWYRSHTADYIKLPIMNTETGVRLITGERVENLMLYPMQKFDYAEPLLELVLKVKNLMQNENCKFLIVAGYSFRDDYITRIIMDAARRNREMVMIIIDPKAAQIYEDRLKYFEGGATDTSWLSGRVVCLPYRFEDVLPLLKDHYLANLKLGQRLVDQSAKEEISKGNSATWINCLEPLANAEYTEKIEALFNSKLHWLEIGDSRLYIEVLLKLGLNLLANGLTNRADEHIIAVKETLYHLLVHDAKVLLDRKDNEFRLTFLFNMDRLGFSEPEYITISDLTDYIQQQYRYIQSRTNMTQKQSFAQFSFITKILRYLSSFNNDSIDYNDFISMSTKYIDNQQHLNRMHSSLLKSHGTDEENTFVQEIKQIWEKATIDLFS